MPRRCQTDARLPSLLATQDWVISRAQALQLGLTARAVQRRVLVGQWQRLIAGVYFAAPVEPTRRQLMVAVLLWAGEAAAIDGVDACRFYGLRSAHVDDSAVHVVVPQGHPARSLGFVAVRRTSAPLRVVRTERVRYVDPAAAVIAATRQMRSDRRVLALISEAVQRRLVTHDELLRAHLHGSPRNAVLGDRALADIGAGVRSTPEADFRRLAEVSAVLPPLLYNCLLRLPSGQLLSPDALALDAALVHETNGRRAHERADLFDDMQERHDVLTDAGFTVLHSSPRRLRTRGRVVIGQFERLYLRHAGRGLPPGVVLQRIAA